MAKTDTKSVEFPNGSGSWHIGEWDELALADFIKEHLHDDVATLRLKKWKPLPFPVEFAITQIAVRKKLSLKLPSLYNDIIAPSELAAEQCSSEATAKYKQHLVVGETLCDLTGGMGIDILFMAENMLHAVYVEQNASYCDIAQRNFNTLHRKNITVVNKDCVEYINHTNENFDTIYIDPARRDNQNGRVYSLRECFPDVVSILQPIISKCKRFIIKASTMADITQIRKELGESVHAANMCEEDIVEVGRVATCFRVEVRTASLETTCLKHNHPSLCQFIQINRELVGIPTVLIIASVGIDTAEHTRIGSRLQLMFECMTGQRSMISLDIQCKVLIQTVVAEETDNRFGIHVVLMFSRLHRLRFDKEHTFETILTAVIASHSQHHSEVFLLTLHISI